MAIYRGDHNAFGQPGIEPRWTHGDKQGIGTAYSASSRLWFTIWQGIVTELYFPTVDRPQIRDLQYLVTDGETFFHDEVRHLKSQVECLESALGYRVQSADPEGRYTVEKEIITDPHLPCLLQRTRVTGDPQFVSRLKLYVLCAPHLNGGGWGNNAYVMEAADREILVAEKNGIWLALAATHPFSRLSCGYVGRSDGWTDLADGFRMDWEFDRAVDGNVALTGEIDLGQTQEFTLGLAFGDGLQSALAALFQGLAIPFDQQRQRFQEQWSRPDGSRAPLEAQSSDGGNLYHSSYKLLLAHEDKIYQGALIASLSIPWGEASSDDDGLGGYHLVWTRDMVNSALGLLAAGNRKTPLRALIYLATSQLADGSFPQNFWIDGKPYWKGIQLDEVAFPIMLADRLRREEALENFDPYPTVMLAAGYLMQQGPSTRQERWEEVSGYSPSTLAANITAMICAAGFARERGDEASATFLEQYADFLEGYIETWTVTDQGTLLPQVQRHFVRINPAEPGNPLPDKGVNDAILTLANKAPGEQADFLAREIVDAGFLELVRYGIRRADDPLIVDSLRVVDATLKVETPFGPCWRRYNHDGYGQQADGKPYTGSGIGRGWPLLTGERGHYEVAAGGDAQQSIRAMEKFSQPSGLISEQVWDEPDKPDAHMFLGCPTGAAMPLLWAHAEYIKLLRSVRDGQVFDRHPEVAARYLGERQHCHKLKVWSALYPAGVIKRGHILRIQAAKAFRLHWSRNGWQTAEDTASSSTAFGIDYVDLSIPPDQRGPIQFTFYWVGTQQWEGQDYSVEMQDS